MKHLLRRFCDITLGFTLGWALCFLLAQDEPGLVDMTGCVVAMAVFLGLSCILFATEAR